MTGGALVIHGRGAELGSLRWLAEDLVKTELKGIPSEQIKIRSITRRDDFFQALFEYAGTATQLEQLHVYSHSIGSALFLGYKDRTIDRRGMCAERRGGIANYISVLNLEVGGVFTDDLLRNPYAGYRDSLRRIFTPGAIIKLWGCNAGVDGWRYSDAVDSTNTRYVADLDAPAACYYWRALNERNSPKPSIAQTFADFFNVKVLAATAGTHTQAFVGGKWVDATRKGKILVRGQLRVAQRSDTLRLAPDGGGDYREYLPR